MWAFLNAAVYNLTLFITKSKRIPYIIFQTMCGPKTVGVVLKPTNNHLNITNSYFLNTHILHQHTHILPTSTHILHQRTHYTRRWDKPTILTLNTGAGLLSPKRQLPAMSQTEGRLWTHEPSGNSQSTIQNWFIDACCASCKSQRANTWAL